MDAKDLHDLMPLMPFYCLVTGKVVRKSIVTRVVESLVTAAIAAVMGGYLAISIATAKLEERTHSVEIRLADHIAETVDRERQIFNKLDVIQDCMMKRCNK